MHNLEDTPAGSESVRGEHELALLSQPAEGRLEKSFEEDPVIQFTGAEVQVGRSFHQELAKLRT